MNFKYFFELFFVEKPKSKKSKRNISSNFITHNSSYGLKLKESTYYSDEIHKNIKKNQKKIHLSFLF